MNELEKALALTVEAGATVTNNGYSLYRDRGQKYCVLDVRDLDPDSEEESFDVLTDAVAKFIFRTKL